MSTSKHIDKLCAGGLALALVLTLLFLNGQALGVVPASRVMGYENRLFDTSRVHTLEIRMDGWDDFLSTCENEEYSPCSVVIDNEGFPNVGLRAKGNTSLSNVSALGSDRYSFKLEFDHYDAGKTYHGLDKLCLNNLIQDNTMMKDYLTYRMMAQFGAVSPLCSFVFLTVNGEDWGLYLAVEGVEDSFLQRNYGAQHGALYKPDSMSFGGGRGNGREFNMEDFNFTRPEDSPSRDGWDELPGEGSRNARPAPGEESSQPPGHGGARDMGGGPGGGMGSDDVKLKYTDDSPDSYSNIFDSAKTETSEADQARLIQSLKALGQGDTERSVDIDAVLRYFVVHNFVVNGDSYTGSMIHNYYLYEEDGLLSMLPWDYNLAFGSFRGGSASEAVNDPIDTPLSVTGDGDRPMADWIFSDPEYTQLYHQYFAEFLTGVDPAALIDEAHSLIAPYVERDPTKFCTYEEFETGVQALKVFCALRADSVSGQLAGSIPSTSQGQAAGGAVLVDTSGLNLSDMGSMNQGGGFPGGGRALPGGESPDSGEDVPALRPEESSPPGGGRTEERGLPGGNFSPPPEGSGPGEAAGSSAQILLWASMLILPPALLAVCKFKRFGR